MMNAADKKAVTKTMLIYTIIMVIFFVGMSQYHHISIINENPQISAIISLVLVVIISFTGVSTEICFLICGILGAFIMGIPLNQYAEYLWKNAGSKSIFMIALCGAVVALLSRGDLIDELDQTDPYKNPDQYTDLKHQVSIFCLFYKLQNFIKKIEKKSKILAAFVFFIQSLMLFVSSVVSASTFSAMMNTDTNISKNKKVYINAGILCMCVSGCLLMFFYLRSPWWLFFLGFAEKQKINIQLPIATLLYAIVSFIHGYYLLSKSKMDTKQTEEIDQGKHPLSQRHSMIYGVLMFIFLFFTLPTPISIIANAKDDAEAVKLAIITILILIIVVVLMATMITRRMMIKTICSPQKKNIVNQLRKLMIGDLKNDSGIKAVIGTLILIITILGFRDMINTCIPSTDISNASQMIQNTNNSILSIQGITAMLCSIGILCIASFIGYILGSNFGSFSIGLIIFNIVAAKVMVLNGYFWRRWMFECLIIVSTFWNQVSPVSSNVPATITEKDADLRKASKEAWHVKSFWNIRALHVQIIAMAICIVVAAVLANIGM